MPVYELNLRDYWFIIRKRKHIIILTFIGVVAFTILYTNLQTPIYKASSSVRVVERRSLATALTEMMLWVPADPMASYARLIRSRAVVERAVLELGLVGPAATSEDISRAVASVQGTISTAVESGTNVIRIDVVSDNPKRARDIANKVAEVAVDESIKEKNAQAIMLKEFLEGQLKRAEERLRTTEERLRELRERGVAGVVAPLQARLAELGAKRIEFLKKYTEKHPDIIKIDGETAMIRDRLKVLPETELEYDRLLREVDLNKNSYTYFRTKLEEAQVTEAVKVGDVIMVDPAATPISPISPNRMLNLMMGIVVGVMLSITAGFVVENLDTSIGTIEDIEAYLKLPVHGVVPYLETKKKKKPPLLKQILPHKLTHAEKLQMLREQLLIHYNSGSSTAEAYRILQTNIKIEGFKGELKGKVILVTSAGAQEGKSINAANLAIAMAQMGSRTLLLDADMRRTVLHRLFGLKRNPGLADVLVGTVRFEEAVRTLTDIMMGEIGFDESLKVPGLDNLNVLTAGFEITNPAGLLASDEMAALLKRVRTVYDVVIIDTPPVLAVTDPIVLAPKADGVMLVYRSGKTARGAIGRTKVQLDGVRAQTKGVILNNISPEVTLPSAYYYRYHTKYYTESA